MEVDKIEAFDYMLHLFEEWRDNHETIKGKPFPKLTAMKLLFLPADLYRQAISCTLSSATKKSPKLQDIGLNVFLTREWTR